MNTRRVDSEGKGLVVHEIVKPICSQKVSRFRFRVLVVLHLRPFAHSRQQS
jgi:hypothetical protein